LECSKHHDSDRYALRKNRMAKAKLPLNVAEQTKRMKLSKSSNPPCVFWSLTKTVHAFRSLSVFLPYVHGRRKGGKAP